MAKAKTRNIFHIIVSILFIIFGIYSPFQLIKGVLSLDIGGILACAVGVLMRPQAYRAWPRTSPGCAGWRPPAGAAR